MIFYLAGPIDFELDKGSSWREELKEFCGNNKNVAFFDPVTPYKFVGITPQISEYIFDMNMHAIDHADAVIARIMKGQATIGTPIEIYYAHIHNKPIILISNMEESVYINYFASKCIFVKDINEAYREILKFENQNVELGKGSQTLTVPSGVYGIGRDTNIGGEFFGSTSRTSS
ncbi:nucleoside 2-deoxyribosyltransferase [Candidatus Pacearchaeota archaeon]|nr:nucleoside 2-deoxyribosyltransferase [Candidatus Pacearchaeota archaeon]